MDDDSLMQKILIAADTQADADALLIHLAQFKQECITCTSLNESLKKTGSEKLSLIIAGSDQVKNTDWKHADIKEEAENVPVIVTVSEQASKKDLKTLRREGVTDYLFVPFDAVILRKKVSRHLEYDQISLRLSKVISEKEVSDARFFDVCRTMSGWTWELNSEGYYTFASGNVKSILGYSPEELIGKSPLDLIDEKDSEHVAVTFQNILETRTPVMDLEHWNLTKDGDRICILTSWLPVFDPNGQLTGYRGLDKDITAKKRYEQGLEEAIRQAEETSRLKSEFLANMSHELRSPLNSVILLSQMLAQNRSGDLSEEYVRFAEIINKSGNNLLELINDILDLSKIEAGRMDIYVCDTFITDIVDSIEHTYRHVADEKGIGLVIHVDEKVPDTIMTDQQKLEQILRNFMSNALKFTEQGSVTVEFRYRSDNQSVRSMDQDSEESFVSISVRDTGIGIPENSQALIFEAFRQVDGSSSRRYEGTGLGLSISKELSELIGGAILLESKEGKGSTFTLRIPEKVSFQNSYKTERRKVLRNRAVQDCRSKTVINIPDNIDTFFVGKTILAVDDDMRSLFTLTKILEEKKIGVHKAENGKKAVECLFGNRGIDLVLMDIMMPEMNGYEAVKTIRGMDDYRTVPVIALTSNAMEGDREKCISAGFDDYVSKPVDIENLFAVLERILKKEE